MLFLLLTFSLAAETITGKVIWVHDGDSFLLKDKQESIEIRLWGMTLPNISSPAAEKLLNS